MQKIKAVLEIDIKLMTKYYINRKRRKGCGCYKTAYYKKDK